MQWSLSIRWFLRRNSRFQLSLAIKDFQIRSSRWLEINFRYRISVISGQGSISSKTISVSMFSRFQIEKDQIVDSVNYTRLIQIHSIEKALYLTPA